jgi:hypothetical protein
MSKPKRLKVGTILKGKDGKPDYIKVDNDVTLKKGEFLELESAKTMLAKADELENLGKITPEIADKIRERAEKIPSFVRFEITLVRKEDKVPF